MNKLVFIKILVCFLTFLLVFGAFSALRTIYIKVNEKPKVSDIFLNQPQNSYIADFKMVKNDIIVLIKSKNNSSFSDKLIIVDKNGKNPHITLSLSKE